MSRFIESIRIEKGKPCRVAYHQRRIQATTLNFYGSEASWDLASLIATERAAGDRIYKCRILYDRQPVRVELEPYTIQEIRSLRVVKANDLEYGYKYADRARINNLFELRKGRDDVLILKNGLITDTSYGNIVLCDSGDQWYTPEECLLKGTMRQYLIETGRIIERTIRVEDLRRYTKFRVINALREWGTPPAEVLNID